MSFIGGIFAKDKPIESAQIQGTNLQTPITNGIVNSAVDQSNSGLSQQQAFINALQAQNGVGNQSSVFNQQQALANQLQGVADGTGPNPAQAALNQATSANVANQAALMAGQRGAGANAGLLARQAAMQGANTQQQAAGQAATMQAQQQIAGMQALGAQQANMANLAGQQVGQQGGAIGNFNQFAQGQQNQLLGAVHNQNNANIAMQSNVNNARVAMQNGINNISNQQNESNKATQMAAVNGIASGGASLASGGGSSGGSSGGKGVQGTNALSDPAAASGAYTGGLITSDGRLKSAYAQGGEVSPGGPQSFVGRHLKGQMTPATMLSHGGKVPALVSPGERYLPPKEVAAVAAHKKSPLKAGQKIPGKASVKGDSLKNDTVSKTLEAGGIVIPRSVMQSDDPAKNASKFVVAVLRNGLKR